MRLRLILLSVVLHLLSPKALSQDISDYMDTLYLNGPSLEHLSKYATYWIDEGGNGKVANAEQMITLGEFKHWDLNTTLNLGPNPHPLWLHLKVKNISDRRQTYWWSLYSHADSIILYRKVDDFWLPVDTSSFNQPARHRNVPVRFLATRIDLKVGEAASLLLKVRNFKKPQNAITDITTPAHNLLWEKKFFWTIGFFIGALILLGILCSVLGIILRQQTLFILAAYILIVAVVILQEELLISFYPGEYFFDILMHLPTTGLTLLGSCLHFVVIDYTLGQQRGRLPIRKILRRINITGMAYALLYILFYAFFEKYVSVESATYQFFWKTAIILIVSIMISMFINIINAAQKPLELLFFIPLAFLLLYFNAAGYYLNYEGLLPYYEITYPNYFYWVLCVEFIMFGLFIGWRYRKTLDKNHQLEQEKAIHLNELFERELATQERERKQIARDLHDDLGATISAIKLIITNSYKKDEHLVNLINRASNDLRFFIGNFSTSNLHNTTLFNAAESKISELNDLNRTRFSLIAQGDDTLLPAELQLSVYRMISELLANVLKHAKAHQATLQIIIEDKQLQILAEDDGVGYDTSISHAGMGLDNIHTRTNKYHGNVHIVSDRRSGTTTIITIPFPSL
ncbi:histidine kinase [Fulvivirga ulvae]|uniref:sensor histidine kinase n=1 Tax=Fulvivirga ulvae TaxID=2904245 RepID=UPI001F2B4C2F|nr:ATP-binding protein [Fulvivirga ulvae]UII33175.1 histidine kinase [Fulvivirga ulvae]